MSKVIQRIEAYRYPCERLGAIGEVMQEPFHFGRGGRVYLDCFIDWYENGMSRECSCGKGCKPERIIIEVRKP